MPEEEGVLLRVHAVIERSRANGPGERAVVWTQGCGKACAGCFNPETWKNSDGELVRPVELARKLRELEVDGLTLTGGDPLEQPEAIIALLHALHSTETGDEHIFPLGIICYTGYTWEEVKAAPMLRQAATMIDLLIDGKYEIAQHAPHPLTGSGNQRLHFNPRKGRGESRISRGWVEEQLKSGGALVEFHPLDAVARDDRIGASLADDYTQSDVVYSSVDKSGARVTGFPSVNAQQRKRLRELGVRIESGSATALPMFS